MELMVSNPLTSTIPLASGKQPLYRRIDLSQRLNPCALIKHVGIPKLRHSPFNSFGAVFTRVRPLNFDRDVSLHTIVKVTKNPSPLKLIRCKDSIYRSNLTEVVLNFPWVPSIPNKKPIVVVNANNHVYA